MRFINFRDFLFYAQFQWRLELKAVTPIQRIGVEFRQQLQSRSESQDRWITLSRNTASFGKSGEAPRNCDANDRLRQ